MRWIESGGGPLIIVPEVALSNWEGVARTTIGSRTDYDRACAVDDNVGTIAIGDFEALVLGDEPLRTTWLPDDIGGWIVRWVYAESEDEISSFVRDNVRNVALDERAVTFNVPGSCVLFDSAEPGYRITGDSLFVRLPPGHYVVRSGMATPSESMRILLHYLDPSVA